MLLCRREPRVQRQHVGVRQLEPAERVGGVVDLALAAEEDEHVARPFGRQLVDRIAHRLHLIAIVVDV